MNLRLCNPVAVLYMNQIVTAHKQLLTEIVSWIYFFCCVNFLLIVSLLSACLLSFYSHEYVSLKIQFEIEYCLLYSYEWSAISILVHLQPILLAAVPSPLS